jgi:hypothetical protein
MALSSTTKTLMSIKKLVGKAHTSNDKDVANESLPTGLTLASSTIFSQVLPTTTGSSAHYEILRNSSGEGIVEFLRLSASFIAGSDTSDGRHSFELKLPDDYEAVSSNPLKGTYPYKNQQSINIASGALQLVPTSFGAAYEAKPYHTGSGQIQIPVLDSRDWNLDYFNGTGVQTTNPKYVDAYLYIGNYLSDNTFTVGLSGSLTKLSDGSSFIKASTGINVLSQSNGAISIKVNKEMVFNELLSGVVNGSNTLFTLANTPFASNEISIFVNGQLQIPPSLATFQDYSVTGSYVYFASGSVPETNSLVLAMYNKVVT